MSEGWLLPLIRIWHRTFGEVKCWIVTCPVCGPTDWPVAPWVVGRPDAVEAEGTGE